jgi:hypothetical protein
MLITCSKTKTLKPKSIMDYYPSEEFSKSSLNGQHLFKNKIMKTKEMIKWAFITYTVIFIILGIIGTLTYYLP